MLDTIDIMQEEAKDMKQWLEEIDKKLDKENNEVAFNRIDYFLAEEYF